MAAKTNLQPSNNERSPQKAYAAKFYEPAKCDRWAAIALVSKKDDCFTEEIFRKYVSAFLECCKRKGMQIKRPAVEKYILGATAADMMNEFYAAKDTGANFIHYVTSLGYNFHVEMKMLDWKERFPSQEITTSKAAMVVRPCGLGNRILNYITNSVNEKLGGVSSGLKLEELAGSLINERTLIIGIDHWNLKPHAAWSSPCVVGYSSNASRKLSFDGGCRYGWIATKNKCTRNNGVIYDLVVECFKRFSAKRSVYPSGIIVFRSGLDPDQFSYAVEYEIPQIEEAYRDMAEPNRDLKPQLTFLSFTELKGSSRPSQTYHSSLKYTSAASLLPDNAPEWKVIKYRAFKEVDVKCTILFDSAKIDIRGLKSLVRSLTQTEAEGYLIPAPIRAASDMMRRGCTNFNTLYPDRFNEPSLQSLSELNSNIGFTYDDELNEK